MTPPSRFNRNLSIPGSGGCIPERPSKLTRVFDADGDGYLDPSLFPKQAVMQRGYKHLPGYQFIQAQSYAYRLGKIKWFYHPANADEAKKVPSRLMDFDYAEVKQVDGRYRIFVYYAANNPSTKLLAMPLDRLKTVKASEVEAKDRLCDQVDATENSMEETDVAAKFHPHFYVDVNRPPAGSSPEGYYAIDLSDFFPPSPAGQALLEHVALRRGIEDANCFNSALYFAGVIDRLVYVAPKDFWGVLQDPTWFQKVEDARPGDIVVWHFQVEVERDGASQVDRRVVHAFIDIGGGWALIKNGTGEAPPYRLQRVDRLRQTYMQYVNDPTIQKHLKYLEMPGGEPRFIQFEESRYRPADMSPVTSESSEE